MMRRWGISLVALLVACCVAAQPSVPAMDPTVQGSIQSAFPGSTILLAADIDPKNCGPAPESPGFVAGDFDGDGRTDFAVLVKLGETGKVITWGGKKLRETRYGFAIFLARSDGTYNLKRAMRFVDYSPLMMLITLQPPGTIQGPGDPGHRSEITLKHSAVERINCGKSSVVYYLSGQTVREFWTSD
jgi:hypothetical protein